MSDQLYLLIQGWLIIVLTILNGGEVLIQHPGSAAEDLRVPMPVASLLRDRFLNLLAHGGDRLHWSAIGRLAAADAGTAAFSTL